MTKCHPSDPRRALFTTTLHYREKTDILLHGVTSEAMTLILEYAYLRSLEITKNNVCQVCEEGW